jgi:SAM-dependent methyltransferase
MILNIYLAKFLLRLGKMIQASAVLAMRSDDLIRFSRNTYRRPEIMAMWMDAKFVDEGLDDAETDFLRRIPFHKGEILLLGLGTGREAIALARHGYHVTGIDFIPEYIEFTEQKAQYHGLNVNGVVGDISRISLSDNRFQVIWFSPAMYSLIPTRKRRQGMLRRLHSALVDGGVMVCQFHMDPDIHGKKINTWMRRVIGFFLLGNSSYESGDMLWRNMEFLHAFKDQQELADELSGAGFKMTFFTLYSGGPRGGAILEKQ